MLNFKNTIKPLFFLAESSITLVVRTTKQGNLQSIFEKSLKSVLKLGLVLLLILNVTSQLNADHISLCEIGISASEIIIVMEGDILKVYIDDPNDPIALVEVFSSTMIEVYSIESCFSNYCETDMEGLLPGQYWVKVTTYSVRVKYMMITV